MGHYKRVDLGDSANNYISECLSNGPALVVQLLKEWSLSAGKVYTYLPGDISSEDAKKFKGILSSKYKLEETKEQDINGQKWKPKRGRVIDLVLNIYRLLSSQPHGIFIVHDLINSIDAARQGKEECNTNLFTHNGEVYFGVLSEDGTLARIEETLMIPTGHFLIGMVSIAPEKLAKNDEHLTEEDLRTIARNIKMLIIGAYDEEGYIIWEKNTRK